MDARWLDGWMEGGRDRPRKRMHGGLEERKGGWLDALVDRQMFRERERERFRNTQRERERQSG